MTKNIDTKGGQRQRRALHSGEPDKWKPQPKPKLVNHENLTTARILVSHSELRRRMRWPCFLSR